LDTVFRFGQFELDPTAYLLRRQGTVVPLSPKALDLLWLLARQPGTLLTKDDIFRAIWPDVAVTDNALTQVVSDLRQALGETPDAPQYIQTVARRGYRFVASVSGVRRGSDGGQTGVKPSSDPRLTPPVTPPSVIVLDFANVTGDVETAWLSAGVAETVTSGLRALGAFRVMDRVPVPPGAHDGVDAVARARLIDLAVVGSVQRAGDRLRLAARVVDTRTREALADARADGALADVFAVQDALVEQLIARLPGGAAVASPPARRANARETSSLVAYRAVTEGRLELETLDPALVPGAIALFEQALALDPQYAVAHVGLAHARFWMFQASRAQNRPAREPLVAAIAHARRAVEIDPELAEGHAALALFLASADRPREAVTAGRVAVALEPGNWRHQFRLGLAAWGAERVGCLEAVLQTYPRFTHACFALAMVHIARGDVARAVEVLDDGLAEHATPINGPVRFPANGLHWLRGLIDLSQGRVDDAILRFDRELSSAGSRLFVDEFAMDAYDGHGFARLVAGDAAGAAGMFERALARFPDHARSLIGWAEALDRTGAVERARQARARAAAAIGELQAAGRLAEAALAAAFLDLSVGDQASALARLTDLLTDAPPGLAGWTIPIEPLLARLAPDPRFAPLLEQLRQRAA